MASEPRIEVVVVGAGVIGTAIARRLAIDGRRVAVFDEGEIGRQASWAAAGLLSPIHPKGYSEALLGAIEASEGLWPEFARSLEAESGVGLEYRREGLLVLFAGEDQEEPLEELVAFREARGREVRLLSPSESRRMEPGLAGSFERACFLPDVAQVRNCRVPRALAASASARGVSFFPHTRVFEVAIEGDRAVGVRTATGTFRADEVVIAAGAWSSQIRVPGGTDPLGVEPVKGQIVLLEAPPGLVRHPLLWGDRYLVPRADGRVLVGSTVEFGRGFDTNPTAGVVADLAQVAARLVPSLGDARFARAWAGLRPYAPDARPLVGPVPGTSGLWVATGHFRSGIILAPITAEILAAQIAGRTPLVDPAPFGVRATDRPTPR